MEEEEKIEFVEEEGPKTVGQILRDFWHDVCDYFRGIKMMIFGNALLVIGFIETFQWTDVVPDELTGLWNLGIGMIVLWLRMVTRGPVKWMSGD